MNCSQLWIKVRVGLLALVLAASCLCAQVPGPEQAAQPLTLPILLASSTQQAMGVGAAPASGMIAVAGSTKPGAAEAAVAGPVAGTDHAAGHKTMPTAEAPNYWESLALILYSDAVMSVENVLVIAILVSTVPQRIRVVATFFGLLAAGVFRVIFASLATVLMKFDVVGLLGSIALIFLTLSIFADTVKQMQKKEEHPPEEKLDFAAIRKELGRIFSDPGFWKSKEGEALKTVTSTVILQDILLSLDNVLVVAGNAHGDISLTILGVALSIVMMATIANFMVKIVQKYPVLGFIGGLALAKASYNLFHQSYDPEAAVVAFGSIVVFVMFSRVYIRLTTDEEAIKPLEIHLSEEGENGNGYGVATPVVTTETETSLAGGDGEMAGGFDPVLVRELVQLMRKNGDALSRIEAFLATREAAPQVVPGDKN